MIINFKNVDHKYITDDGIIVPKDLIYKYKHEFDAWGDGWVDVPVFTPDGEVRLIGIVETELKATEVCIHGEEGELVPEKVKITKGVRNKYRLPTTSGFTLELEDGEDTSFGAEELKDLGVVDETFQTPVSLEMGLRIEKGKVTQIRDISPDDFDKIAKTMVETGIQFVTTVESTLRLLGLIPRPEKSGLLCRWYHPAFGDDKRENHLYFDPETDPLESIGVKLFRLGGRLGTNVLKAQIKNTLEQH